MKWNDIHKDESSMSIGIYKRGGRPWDAIVLSQNSACKKLASLLSQQLPELIVAPSIVAAATPAKASVAIELLETYPQVMLDEASVAALLEKDAIKKLVLDPSVESRRLVVALQAKSEAIKRHVVSSEMLADVLDASTAFMVQSFLKANSVHALSSQLEKIISDKSAQKEVESKEELESGGRK